VGRDPDAVAGPDPGPAERPIDPQPDKVPLEALGGLLVIEVRLGNQPLDPAAADAERAVLALDREPVAGGFEAMDDSALVTAVDAALAADPAAWAKFVAGEDKALGAIVGRVMKATKGQADGKAVNALLQARRRAG